MPSPDALDRLRRKRGLPGSRPAPPVPPPPAPPAPKAPAPLDRESPEFRGLPRDIQRQVEAGSLSLADAVARARKQGVFGRFGGFGDPAGGGGVPRPPRPRAGGAVPGGGGGGGGGGLGQTRVDEGLDVDNLIKQQFQDILSGKLSRFSDKTLASMKQGLFEATRGQARASQQEALRLAAVTGTFRSPVTQRVLRDIDASARAQYTQGVRDILLEKARAEFEDRMAALQLAQQWLNSRRQYILGKEQIQATLKAASIQAGATVRAAELRAAATRAAAGASLRARMAELDLAREKFEWQKEMQQTLAESQSMQSMLDLLFGRG